MKKRYCESSRKKLCGGEAQNFNRDKFFQRLPSSKFLGGHMSQLIIASEKKLAKDLLISERHVRSLFKEYKYAPGEYEYIKCVKKYLKTIKVDGVEHVTLKLLADILCVSEKTIRNLTKENILQKSENGNYNLKTNIKKYFLENNESNKLKVIQRETQELKLKILKDEYYPDHIVRDILSDMLIKFKSQLLSTSRKITIEIEQNEKADIKKVVEKHILKSLEELEKYAPPSNKGDR